MRNIIGISMALLLAAAGTASAAPVRADEHGVQDRRQHRTEERRQHHGLHGREQVAGARVEEPTGRHQELRAHGPRSRRADGGAGFWHWVVYNIPADATSLPEGAGDAAGTGLPKGAVQGNTDMGKPGYVGPCPPPGPKHHYNFMLYPLKVDKLEIPPGATAAYCRLQRQRERDRQACQADRRVRPPQGTAAPKAAATAEPPASDASETGGATASDKADPARAATK